jgi:hypothetical protein
MKKERKKERKKDFASSHAQSFILQTAVGIRHMWVF